MRKAASVVLAAALWMMAATQLVCGDAAFSGMIFYVGSNQAVVDGKTVQIDQSNANVISILRENRAFLPLRFVSEYNGGTVEWNAPESKAVIHFDNDDVEVEKGSGYIQKNGIKSELDVPAFEEEGRLYIPIRAVGELLGKEIRYERGLVIVANSKEQAAAVTDGQINDYIMKLTGISVVGTKETLDSLMEKNITRNYGGGGSVEIFDSVAPAVEQSASAEKSVSETNTQVEGVDEADMIKTDGTYIYKVSMNKLYIVKATPAEEMKLLCTLDFPDFNVNDMYLDGDRFVLIGSSTTYEPAVYDSANQKTTVARRPGYYGTANTEVRIYNAKDKEKPELLRSVVLEGNLVTSRRIGSALYIVSNQYAWYGTDVPIVKENGSETPVDYSKMYYFPGTPINSYLIVSGIDMDQPEKKVSSSAFLGGGNIVYVSAENLYVTSGGYPATDIYKFAVSGGDIQFLNKGSVQGTIKDQFSMDEYEGYFRVATTSYDETEKNNLYILGSNMQEVSKITDIAPGERIYSMRYTGSTGYMVTFRQVDPLFVIDLTPKAPKILGQLKIPGYSEYLHPYKDNYVIGFGKDATAAGLYKGLKIALFDASDPVNPKELFSEYIGDRGTDSAVLNNHKALMIMPELDIIALPVDLYEADKKDTYNDAPQGMFRYQGGFAYKVTPETGFTLLGKVTHLSDEDYLKSGSYGGDTNKYIDRLLYIDGYLYASSGTYITANRISDFTKAAEIELK